MREHRDIVVVNYEQGEGIPCGKDMFYLCLECKTVIHSVPESYQECKCGNVFVDADAGRGGAHTPDKLLILKIE